MGTPLPPPTVGRREPERTEWITQLEPRRWYLTAPAWIALGAASVVLGALWTVFG